MFHVKHSRSCANALRKEERAESRRKSPTREPTGRERAEDEAGRFIPGTNVSRETLFCAIGRVKASREGRTPRRERENMRREPTSSTRTARGRPGAKCAERTRNAAALGRSARTPRDETARGIQRGSKQGKREAPESGTNVSRETFSILRERAPQEEARRKPAEGDRARMRNGRTRKTRRRRNVPAGLLAKRGRTPSVGRPSGIGRPQRDRPSETERPGGIARQRGQDALGETIRQGRNAPRQGRPSEAKRPSGAACQEGQDALSGSSVGGGILRRADCREQRNPLARSPSADASPGRQPPGTAAHQKQPLPRQNRPSEAVPGGRPPGGQPPADAPPGGLPTGGQALRGPRPPGA